MFTDNFAIYAGEGAPVQATTFYIWFMVELPGNIALPKNISPIKHPKAQMSIYLL